MKIATGVYEAKSNLFSGFYSQRITGLRGKYYEFSSPTYSISNFSLPYDAFLLNTQETGDRILGVGRRIRNDCPVESNRSGSLYFQQNLDIVGTCHGHGHNDKTYYSGYNFYNAFYPAGYFAPPFGENISIFRASEDEYNVLNNGSCNSLNVTEYNELHGIISKSSSSASLVSSTLTSNLYSLIMSPKEVCPPEVVISSYYDEFQLSHIPGTSSAIGGNNFYNSNPIPTAIDGFNIKVNGRYQIYKDEEDNRFIKVDGGKPVPSYGMGNEENKLNNALCQASLMEGRVSQGKGSNGLMLVAAPDALFGAIGDQVSFVGNDYFHYWHFTFEENAETLPFFNNFILKGSATGFQSRRRAAGEGTQLFSPVLSSHDSWWQNRQCPATVDFLPWTFGGTIYACPSEHFDIPYYAALRRFGFYGTRFLNTCVALNLESDWSGVPNATELAASEDIALDEGEIEPVGLDKEGSWSFSIYNNLLKIAKAEENYANMYALNKGFFIWANSGEIATTEDFSNLSGNSGFLPIYNNLVRKFQDIFVSGIQSFTGNEPSIILTSTFDVISSGQYNHILATNDEFLKFKTSLETVLSPSEMSIWNNIERNYSYYVAKSGAINQEFYQTITSGREKRLITRYFENLTRGKPIDLFPLNKITFSFDAAKDYIEHTGWGKSHTAFGKASDLPEINRRYFEGAYGRRSATSGLMEVLNQFSSSQIDYFYPGFFHDIRLNKDFPILTYQRAVSGKILDETGRNFTTSGWLGLGYNEIGAYDAGFSCFTPIFIQNPLPRVFCKIGQRPTFRSLAVDYHTIPQDKISRRYPEIIYWCSKLKMLDCNGRYLYPLKYKWYRIRKEDYSNNLNSGTLLSAAQASSFTGDWGCLDGDGADCEFFRPKDSFPVYSGRVPESSYTFIKGAVKNQDDNYYYFNMASGRFGVRISNPSELNIEDWLRFDVSVKNGMNLNGEVSVKFEVKDYQGTTRSISLNSDEPLPNYAGYQQELNTAAETIVEQKIPPPNAGWGDVRAFRFRGPIAYIGGTRSYAPAVLKDTRGLRELWGHLLEYGQLVPLGKKLSQDEGDWLYGYNHLPECVNYQLPNGKAGVKVTVNFNGATLSHWSLGQKAVASLDNKAGIQWDKLGNIGELYPPINSNKETPNFGIGHWQWGNNLGAIKRFGKAAGRNDITFVGSHGISEQKEGEIMVEKIKDKLLKPSDLAGSNCGYTPYGLGRNMLYFIEAYERFYILCDPVKKKNVTNKSFIAPGLRLANSAIQYFWLGKPHNTYLKRRPMYGPYAYQWKVERHNRDRNGNGISQGFYSMGHGKEFSLLYDAPAIYGLYVRKDTNSFYSTLLKELKDKRESLKERLDLGPTKIRGVWFGERGNEGTARRYGNAHFSCQSGNAFYDPDICEYVGIAQSLASNINFGDHVCPLDLVSEGACFDPCMSIRYAQGFFPGGKTLDLFGQNSAASVNDPQIKNIKIIPLAKVASNSVILGDENSETDNRLAFRNPLNTPHARITQGLKTIAGERLSGVYIGGLNPCQDGGSDHCNYITPTIHFSSNGEEGSLVGNGNGFSSMRGSIGDAYDSAANVLQELT